MPYYCTVPRCTSMAGKAKNVSFHQFPRDEELALLWNKILKRGKPYTKYSKVCSLHFRPEDYTITSVGKNKGQWRTLRKDAIPSQNLPSESPGPTSHRNSGAWVPNLPSGVIDPMVQQQMAHAIYMQTMLVMQAANNGNPPLPTIEATPKSSSTSPPSISEIETLIQNHAPSNVDRINENEDTPEPKGHINTSYKCQECTKCFKDPDVFILHKRMHTRKDQDRIPDKLSVVEKENLNANSGTRQETLRANPILANLLKSGVPNEIQEQLPNAFNNDFNVNNILSIENQIMAALAANMESYIRNLSMLQSKETNNFSDLPEDDSQNEFDQNSDENKEMNEDDQTNNEYYDNLNEIKVERVQDSAENSQSSIQEICNEFDQNSDENKEINEDDQTNNEYYDNLNEIKVERVQDSPENSQNSIQEICNFVDEYQVSKKEECEPSCDNEDLNESKDSNNLVIDENV